MKDRYEPQQTIVVGTCRYDQYWRRLDNGRGVGVVLTATEGRLLLFLAVNADRWVSIEELAIRVWDHCERLNSDRYKQGVRLLRKKIQVLEADVIDSDRVLGYRFRPAEESHAHVVVADTPQ
jgi:DNA-binding response OmpR family regulator